jgi:hypothetical protein
LTARCTHADVIVLANRTAQIVSARFVAVAGEAQQLTLASGETTPVFLDGKGEVTFPSKGIPVHYAIDANCAYYFGRSPDGRIDLQKIGLGDDGTAAEGRKLPGSAGRAPTVFIPVKILVDEEEPARQPIWERRLRARVEAASAILERHCRVGFRVTAVGTWKTNNATTDFFDSLAEFEHAVNPSPARVAIGFTSQFPIARGRMHMAGTRGPLHSHILVREGSPEINEAERLEFLVHELGHYLGAAHSPEWQSVMRPVLGDNRAGRSDFRIQFDPVNTLAMSMVCEEIRRSNLTKISQLNYVTRRRLAQIYRELDRALPDDPAGMQYARLMKTDETPVAAAARQVVQKISSAAVDNRALPTIATGNATQTIRREGDVLTDYYVREAARATSGQPGDVAPQAFLLGLAVGLDDANSLATIPGLGSQLRVVEAPSERTIRLTALGKPTVRGRLDLIQHFFTSAYLTSVSGAETVQTAAVDRAVQDADRPGGMSFKVLAADRAGCRFGKNVIEKRLSLGKLAATFSVASFMPDVAPLPEGVSTKDFAAQYGTKTDPRFLKKLREIDDRTMILPGYEAVGPVFTGKAP